MDTPPKAQDARPDRSHLQWYEATPSHQGWEAAVRSAVEDKARLVEVLRTQPSKLLGPFEQGPQADIEITVDDLRRLAEDPEDTARFAKLHEDSQARMKQCADAYVARHAPTAGTTPHDREQQQAVTPQHPGHRPLR